MMKMEGTPRTMTRPTLSLTTSRRGLVSGGLALSALGTLSRFTPAAAQDATPAASPVVAIPAASPVGGAVDPQMQEVLDALAAFGNPPIESTTPDVARNLPSFANALRVVEAQRGIAPSTAVTVQGITVPGPEGDIACRTYRPSAADPAMPLPVVAYFHGGGFVIANLDTYEASCLAVAEMAQCLVVSVAYRQAPEHPLTATVDDAYAATQYLLASAGDIGGDPARVAVFGESAGGNLATVVCLKARDEGGMMPIHQVLVYPITTYVPEGDQTTSIQQFADAKPLNAAMLDWFKGYYLPDPADAENAYASPLLAPDLGGLPPATIIQAEIDPLQGQGTTYAQALEAAGVEVTSTLYTGVTHEFFGMGTVVDKAREAEMEAAQALTTAFGG